MLEGKPACPVDRSDKEGNKMVNLIQTDVKRILFVGRKEVGKSKLALAFTCCEGAAEDSALMQGDKKCDKIYKLVPYELSVKIQLLDLEHLCNDNGGFDEDNNWLENVDFIIVVLDGRETLSIDEVELFLCLKKLSRPYLAAVNKIEYGVNSMLLNELSALNIFNFEISCKEKVGIENLKSKMIRMMP
jgi:GTP-binding protein EngB required for normal cell division